MDALTKTLNNFSGYAHWALRLAIASVFIYHGVTKFPNLSGMAGMMGLPVAVLGLVAVTEVAAGVLVLAGGFGPDILTRLGGALVIPVMLGAIVMVHWGRWSFTPSDTHPMGGMEFQVVLVLIGLFLLLVGNRMNDGQLA